MLIKKIIMTKEIEELEQQVQKLKQLHDNSIRAEYEKSTHKNFKDGDIVKKGDQVGIVAWTENKMIGCDLDRGYMGVSLISGRMGFMAPCKRDEWELVTDSFYTDKHIISIELTGIEAMRLAYDLGYRNCNPSNIKSKVLDVLESLHDTSSINIIS